MYEIIIIRHKNWDDFIYYLNTNNIVVIQIIETIKYDGSNESQVLIKNI